MKWRYRIWILVIVWMVGFILFVNKGYCQQHSFKNISGHSSFFQSLLSLHQTKVSPGPYDWLASHPEPGQSFSDYIDSYPVIPDQTRKYIDIIMLGDFDETQRKLIRQAAEYIQIFYGLPIRIKKDISLSRIPNEAKREHPVTQDKQILSSYLLDNVLPEQLGEDTFCLIAFTTSDLWPGEGWNFVFGQASIIDRVGVWSIYRNGDPHESEESYQLCLKRTIKIGIHEIGHMFSMYHCIYFECLMNGSNHIKESDQVPLALCPVCLRKLAWANKEYDWEKRYEKLIDICQEYNFGKIAEFYIQSRNILRNVLKE